MMKKTQRKVSFKLEHVDRLSRGKRSGINIGSRSVGHYLKQYEREIYQRALQHGYLEVTEKTRANLWHIWEKACQAQNKPFIVLVKDIESDQGSIYKNGKLFCEGTFYNSKTLVKQVVESKR